MIMTFDEKLAAALSNTAEARAAQMVCVQKKHNFSFAYRLWEYKTLRDLGKNRYDRHWTLHRARHAAAALTVVASLLLGTTVYAVGGLMGRYTFDTKPDYSKVFIESISSDKTTIEEYYGLSEEDGWKIVDYTILSDSVIINYVCNGNQILFSQNIIGGNMGHINTEDSVVEPMSLFEENDGFFVAFKGGDCGLYWIYDGYFFKALGNITKSEAINLAYSTKIINF